MANRSSADFNWAASRGEAWRAQLAGMEAMLAPVDAPLLDALHLDAPARIADIGCGGGGTALQLVRRAPRGSAVHGFDISPALIETARARASVGENAVAFTVADVATTQPPGAPFDRLVSRFGVMFFDDAPAAFRNLAMWLAPGGRFAFAVWGRPADNPWFTTLRDVVAELVELRASVTDAPGPFRYGQIEALLGLLGEAGFDELSVREWRGPLAIGGGLPAAAAADFALAAFSVAEPVARADEAVRERARQALAERFSNHLGDGVVQANAAVHIVAGSRAR